jgi:serine/threonine protein phosphatase 1
VKLPTTLDYPIVAIADLHGQREELGRILARLEALDEWPECAVVFLGDFVDRGPDVHGTIDLVLRILGRPPSGSAVMGNHDQALVRAARLDDGPHSAYWTDRYRTVYEADATFEAYLGRPHVRREGKPWHDDLEALREAVPQEHRDFLALLPWVVEAPGHLFLHCGLSRELEASPEEQVEALRERRWDRTLVRPVAGTFTERLWEREYPVWLGADRSLSRSPLPYPGKVQVTGHQRVSEPDVNPVRIRLDTSGGRGELTACLLRSADAAPVFIDSRADVNGSN